VRWMGSWVTRGEREALKAVQPRQELPLEMSEPELTEIKLHGNPWYRASLMM
jgi:hypothetical protein